MKKIFSLIILSITCLAYGQSDLLITPYRVIFEENERIKEVSLANTGADTSRYSVSFVQYTMDEEGAMEQISEPEEGQYFADRFLRFFPRSVTLAPGEAQIVRLQLRMPADQADAEYRSHLYFRSKPEEQPEAAEQTADTALGIQLIPVYGITIPVIVRKGNLDLSVAVGEIAVNQTDNGVSLKLDILREGQMSTFGDIQVQHVDAEGNKHLIGEVRGIAVYTPGNKRTVSIPLVLKPDVDYSTGSLNIVYTSAGSAEKKEYFNTNFTIQ